MIILVVNVQIKISQNIVEILPGVLIYVVTIGVQELLDER